MARSEVLRNQNPGLFTPPVDRVKETIRWESREVKFKDLNKDEQADYVLQVYR